MADFVAVIRRAVDGLATNTPEARTRVYEKARGAVQRQLENMKPRPPEEMLRRQMDKLEAAIIEVETEHAEALPAEPEVAVAPAPVPYEAPEPVEEYAEEPAAAAEPQYAEELAASHSLAEPYREEEPAEAETVAEPYREPETHWEEAPHSEAAAKPAEHDWREAAEEPVAERYGDWRDDVPEEKVEYPQQVAVEETTYSPEADSREEASPFAEERHETHSFAERDSAPAEWQVEPQAPTQDYVAPETVSADHTTWAAPEREPVHQAEEHRADSAWNEVDDLTRHLDAGHRSAPVAAHFGEEMHVSAEPVRMPPATDMPQTSRPADEVDEDPFAAYVNAQPSAPVEQPKQAQPQSQQDEQRDPWSDLEDLIGYTKDAPSSEQKPQKAADEDDFSDLLSPPAKPYRVTPVRKRNYAGMILGLLGLIIIGGGAYGAWMYRDKLNDMVGGLMPSGSSTSETAQQTPAASAPANSGTAAQPPAAQPQQSASTPAQPQTTTPPPADGSSTATKFTQRLLENGSEVDAGPGDAGSLAQNAEGQSVAQLNAPPADPAPAAPSTTGTATPPAGTAAPATPSASATEVPAAAGEKMFLYEERIGQSAPTAIEGSVSWSLQREPGQNGGPAEPVVQGRITIPGRGLTALLTVKKNSDSSLPASHLIEIVFAVPPDFEGGAIDSVLRIAMKQTEQDRGNALVAVPAKITDDFHMIALNDFPDAQRTNLELLRTRNWIDIPLAYRNGRRALLTLQKGPDGVKAFDEAIREWSQNTTGQTGQ
ncbi:hypothetical protein [Aliirhizobium cellulosilyticum]|uniref:Uncharacterized protein n=1 Tax=Aliirhizobium cellulosilyticum TaxID=393664 RepID=A0A7W6UY96_9HYPH|nr:hypothetical protein [Rhizobium cellulosilyticum]MBB4346882.1 hypothetical protein [Rhizobium cellulosilyticum]MBB4410724.1 hypothetical protein [Rhizobium cellulosilyticum]MBB4445412.1 hypothetical protein [Rhizobium cellulosilyticum]